MKLKSFLLIELIVFTLTLFYRLVLKKDFFNLLMVFDTIVVTILGVMFGFLITYFINYLKSEN